MAIQPNPIALWACRHPTGSPARAQEPTAVSAVFVVMRVREENCNMVLLATVTLVSAMVAVISGWWEAPQPAAARPPVYVADQAVADRTEVRVVGAPFVPNVNPRDR